MFLSPYFALWAQYGLFVALLPAAIRALIALFRPMGSIRALGRPLACGNTRSGSGYVLVSLRAYAYAWRSLRPIPTKNSLYNLSWAICNISRRFYVVPLSTLTIDDLYRFALCYDDLRSYPKDRKRQ